jgi:hypothetical protein
VTVAAIAAPPFAMDLKSFLWAWFTDCTRSRQGVPCVFKMFELEDGNETSLTTHPIETSGGHVWWCARVSLAIVTAMSGKGSKVRRRQGGRAVNRVRASQEFFCILVGSLHGTTYMWMEGLLC